MNHPHWTLEDRDVPVVFAGRHSLTLDGVPVLHEALPRSLALWHPTQWVIVDALPFPYEQLSPVQWDAPIDVVLPAGFAPEALVQLLGQPLFSRFTNYDTVVTEQETWRELRAVYGWAEGQWRQPAADIESTVQALLTPADGTAASRSRTRADKSQMIAEAATVVPMIERALSRCVDGARRVIFEMSEAVSGYVTALGPVDHEIVVVRGDAHIARQVESNHPEIEVRLVDEGSELGLAPESLDLALLTGEPDVLLNGWMRPVFDRLWPALRVGGSLVVIRRIGEEAALPLGAFSDILLDMASSNIVLETLASVRNPNTGRVDRAAMQFTKIGVSVRW